MNIEMLNLVEIGVHFTSCFMKKYVVNGWYSHIHTCTTCKILKIKTKLRQKGIGIQERNNKENSFILPCHVFTLKIFHANHLSVRRR